MCTIRVSKIMLGKDYPTAGNNLYNAMIDCLQKEDRIVLDMDGVLLLPSMFLNVSLGRLATERGVNYVKERVGFSHIKVSDAERLRHYFGRFSVKSC